METWNRTLEETMAQRQDKSSLMEEKYQGNPDPWGNGERDTYTPIMARMMERIIENNMDISTWYDIGCGGGYVGKAFYDAALNKGIKVSMKGCDISPTAIEYLKNAENSPYVDVACIDVEDLSLEDFQNILSDIKVVSLVDVVYHLGGKRPWKESMDLLWEALPVGSYVIVADGLIPYQYRDYLKKKEDSTLLVSYTDHDTVLCTETRSNGKVWTRYSKIRIYKKG